MLRRMPRTALVGLLSLALVATGCTEEETRTRDEAGQPPGRGGTLHVLVEADRFPHIDPQRTYDTAAMNVVRLFARTLTTYRPAPGNRGSELVPDLATDLGRPTQGNTVWQFTLKPNVRWQDGSKVTCLDVKHGVERSFAAEIDGGAGIYPRTLLDGGFDYQGPYQGNNNGGKGLESVDCVDMRTVQFRLTRPVGDFSYVAALPVFAPVRASEDTRAGYDRRPFSNGPYQVARYGKADGGRTQLELRRNPHWDQRSDPARRQYPDRILVRFGQNADEMTYRMIADQGEYRSAVALDTKVPPRFVQQVVNDPELAERTITGTTSGVRYLAINTESVPEPACRRALVLAFNKQAFRAALGGSAYGDYASTILPPTMQAHAGADVHRTKSTPQGDPARARALMKKADCPDRVTLDHVDTPVQTQASETVVESLRRIGVQVSRNPIPAERFHDVVTVPSRQHDLVLNTWVPDFPNGSGTIPALFDGRSIRQDGGNYNFSLVNDPEINQLIDAANAEANLERQYRLWGRLDRMIQEKALVVPIVYDRALQMLGSRVRGGFLHPAFLGVDLATVGLA